MNTNHNTGAAMNTDREALDAQLAALQKHTETVIAYARAVIAQHPGVPGRRPDEMEPGGWVRLPAQHLWRQLRSVTVCDPAVRCRRLDFTRGDPVHVNPWDTFEYRTDAEFQADCDRRQAEEDYAMDRLDFAEWQAQREAS